MLTTFGKTLPAFAQPRSVVRRVEPAMQEFLHAHEGPQVRPDAPEVKEMLHHAAESPPTLHNPWSDRIAAIGFAILGGVTLYLAARTLWFVITNMYTVAP